MGDPCLFDVGFDIGECVEDFAALQDVGNFALLPRLSQGFGAAQKHLCRFQLGYEQLLHFAAFSKSRTFCSIFAIVMIVGLNSGEA